MSVKISVIMPVYNQEQYLQEAIDSVLRQSFKDYELIAVNDGSTDNSPKILEEYSGKIKIINQENKGLAGARNTGICAAQSEMLAFLDSDDKWYPDMLKNTYEHLCAHPEYDMVAGRCDTINKSGENLGAYNNPAFFKEKIRKDFLKALSLVNMFPVHTLLIRRKCFEDCGDFDEELRAMEDWDLWLRMASAGFRADYINAPAAMYRIYGASMTFDGKRMEKAFLRVLEKLFSNNKTASALAEMKEYIYGSAWLRQAVNYYMAKDYANQKRCMKMAQAFFKLSKPDKDCLWRPLSLLAKMPGTNLFAKKISGKYKDELSGYYLLSAKSALDEKRYPAIVIDLLQAIIASPLYAIKKMMAGKD